MNLFYLVCNKCENISEKDIPLNFNRKNSKSSIIKKNVEMSKDEIISSDSTNNLEIIDYPYTINFKEDLSSPNFNKLNLKITKNNHYLNNINKIQKLPNDQMENSIIDINSKKNSLSSSFIINNEDNFIQNKALLNNYYAKYENSKNNKDNNNNKRNTIKSKIMPKKKTFCNKKIVKNVPLKMEILKNDSDIILANKNSKSNRQILKVKKNIKDIKVIKANLEEYQIIQKCQTNCITNKVSSKKKKAILCNTQFYKRDTISKYNNYITYNENIKKVKVNKDKEKNKTNNQIYKLKKIYNGGNSPKFNIIRKNQSSIKIDKKCFFPPFLKLNNSFKDNNNSNLNKINLVNYRNSTAYNIERKKNNLNFSHLWLYNNKDNFYISKSYINPFDISEHKRIRKKLNIIC